MRAIILRNDLTVATINRVKTRRILTYRGGDYVLSPDAINSIINLDDEEESIGSEIIFFENGSSPIPRDVDFSDAEKIKEKTVDYLNEAILDNFLDNTGFTAKPNPVISVITAIKELSLYQVVVGLVGLSIAYSLIMGVMV